MTVQQLIYHLQTLEQSHEVYLKAGPIINEIREIKSQFHSFVPKKWVEIGYSNGN